MRGLATVMVALSIGGCGRFAFGTVTFDGGDDGAAGGDDGGGRGDAADRPNRIFMTSDGTFTASLGGLTGADASCQAAADAASLGGTFVALLWTSTDPPSTRVVGSRGWVDLLGTPIADQPTDLDTRNINPVRIDENGATLPSYTYAFRGGTMPGSGTCVDWTSTTDVAQPLAFVSDLGFLSDVYEVCAGPGHLLCAEVGHHAVVGPVVESGRIAFITAGLWIPNGGLAVADAICQGEAAAGSLAGTYLAYVATSTATAESRFSTTGDPWRRVDGTRITATAADMVGTTPVMNWRSFIGRTATGVETNQRVWTGTASESCSDWTGAGTGEIGESDATNRSYLSLFGGIPCSSSNALICMQQ